MSLQSAGKTDAAKLFSETLEPTPTRGIRIRKAWATHAENVFVTVYSRISTVFVY
jgi:hypothetical protein